MYFSLKNTYIMSNACILWEFPLTISSYSLAFINPLVLNVLTKHKGIFAFSIISQHTYCAAGFEIHSSDRLRRVKMTVGQQDLSDKRLPISDFHISGIGFIYFRQVNGTFRQVIFSCDQAALRTPLSVCLSVCQSVRPSVRLSVCPSVSLSLCRSVCHTFFTMFLSSYRYKIFRSYYQWQKWCPCKRSRS